MSETCRSCDLSNKKTSRSQLNIWKVTLEEAKGGGAFSEHTHTPVFQEQEVLWGWGESESLKTFLIFFFFSKMYLDPQNNPVFVF